MSTSLEPLDRSAQSFVCGSLVTWLGPTTLRYVMYFRFYGDVTFGRSGPYGIEWPAQPSVTCVTGAESDVYECLFVEWNWT